MKKLHVTLSLEMSVPDDWELATTSEGGQVLKLPNGTYLDRSKVTTAARVPMGTPVHIGKTVIELRP